MTSSQRQIKKVIIASIYIVLFATGIFIGVINLFPTKKTVILEKEDIKALEVVKYGAIQLDSGKLDFWAEISNPNDDFGVSKLDYTFLLVDKEGNEIRKNGNSFILPGDKKRYILLLDMSSDYKLLNFELNKNLIWKKLSKFYLPELSIRNISLGKSNKVGNNFTVFGILTNNNQVNLKNIQVISILTDDKKNIVGVNETLIRDVLTGESRDFEMIWNNEIPNTSISDTTIYAQSNILDDRELLIQLQKSPIFDK